MSGGLHRGVARAGDTLPPDAVIDVVRRLFTTAGYSPPMLPSVAVELHALTRKPDATFEQIEHVLGQDGMLAGRVLKIAQSVAYAREGAVRTLHEAAVRIGLRTLSDLFLQVTVTSKVFRAQGFDQPMEALRRHSVATAHAAQVVSRYTSMYADLVFLCGLLHDVGAAAAIIALSEPQIPKAESLRELQFEDLLQAIDEVHEQAAGIVADAWRLPPDIKLVLEKHHRVLIQGHPHPVTATIVVAEHIAIQCGCPGLETAQAEVLKQACEALGLTPATFDLARSEAARLIAVHVESPAAHHHSSIRPRQ